MKMLSALSSLANKNMASKHTPTQKILSRLPVKSGEANGSMRYAL